MARRWLLISCASLVIAAVVMVFWPLTDAKAASIAKVALLRDGVAVENREPTEIQRARGMTLVSFGEIEGLEYVVQVRSRWSRGEVHRMPTDRE